MLKSIKLSCLTVVLIGIITTFSGCSVVENIEKKLGWKTEYFEYLDSKNLEQISIQSTRDLGFKFIVTEGSAKNTMYNLLCKAQKSDKKSRLDPDYIFEFDLGDEVKQFYYVVGSDSGNFYSDTDIYTVSNRIDEVIIQNLSFIRKPKEFNYIYYRPILEVIEKIEPSLKDKDYKIGINIKSDADCLKYIFSNDLKNFISEADKIISNVELVQTTTAGYDVVITIKNRGYDTLVYKTAITVNNKRENTEEIYYVVAQYEYKKWNISISEPNVKPSNW